MTDWWRGCVRRQPSSFRDSVSINEMLLRSSAEHTSEISQPGASDSLNLMS